VQRSIHLEKGEKDGKKERGKQPGIEAQRVGQKSFLWQKKRVYV